MWRQRAKDAPYVSKGKTLSRSQLEELALRFAVDVSTRLTEFSGSLTSMASSAEKSSKQASQLEDCLRATNESLDCLMEILAEAVKVMKVYSLNHPSEPLRRPSDGPEQPEWQISKAYEGKGS